MSEVLKYRRPVTPCGQKYWSPKTPRRFLGQSPINCHKCDS
jgi:hypothetical protein